MGLLSALASGVESYATGRVKELDQQREFDMKKEMLAIEAEKAAMIEDLKAKKENARATETFKRARDMMGPDTEEYTVGDAKNASVMSKYTDEAGVEHTTTANAPTTATREVSLGDRLNRGLIKSIKEGDVAVYDAINTMYGNTQKIDKANKELAAADKPTAKTEFEQRLLSLRGLGTPAEKVEAWILGDKSGKAEDDPYRETPEQKAAREDAADKAKRNREVLTAKVTQKFIDDFYTQEWRNKNMQHNSINDFIKSVEGKITEEVDRLESEKAAVSDTSGMRPSGGPPRSGRSTTTIKVNPALKIH